MSKLFKTSTIPTLDRLTMQYEPIASIDLMERAARTVFDFIVENYSPRETIIFVGPGNNGGDGLVVARLLAEAKFSVSVIRYVGTSERISADNEANLKHLDGLKIEILTNPNSLKINDNALIVDALFGTGLSRKLDGLAAEMVNVINNSNCDIVSIDMPSGLGDESQSIEGRTIVHAKHTIVFQMPKIACYLPEAAPFIGKWHVTDIGLSDRALQETETSFYSNDIDELRQIIRPRNAMSHKGNFGRAVLIAGSKGMMGAAVLSSRACLRSGVGLLTTICPECGYQIMQTAVPEAMCQSYEDDEIAAFIKQIKHLRPTAIGIGPGIGKGLTANELLRSVMNNFPEIPKVIDADGLNIVSEMLRNGENVDLRGCILTPHPVEFERLTHAHNDTFSRIMTASEFAVKYATTVVLKGAYSVIATNDKKLIFNNLGGNSGMATAGSGDVLTGITLGILAQGYDSASAAQLAVGIHSLAGRHARMKFGEHAMIAGDIVEAIGPGISDIIGV